MQTGKNSSSNTQHQMTRLHVPPPLQMVKMSQVPNASMNGPSAKNSQRVPSTPNGGSHQAKRPNSLAVKQLNYHNQNQHSFNQHTPKSLMPKPSFAAQQDEPQQEGGQAPSESYDPKRYQVAAPQARPSVMNQNHQHHLQHQSHSLGRDLQGMGLITQVKKGEKVPSTSISSAIMRPQAKAKQQESQVDQGGRLPLFDLMEDLPLLAPQKSDVRGRKTLVLDLDETLVHSSFKPPTGLEPPADIVLPVDIEGRVCNVFVLARPGCVRFLNEMNKYYEVVIFTASLSKYADPLMDIIDQKMVAPQRLFREHCTFSEELGVFVKDMSRLGRDLKDCIIIDNSPLSFAFQPENGMPILSWYDDRTDTKLFELIPVLKLLSEVPDVRPVLSACCSRENVYLTDKSINMCQYILEDINRKRQNAYLGQPIKYTESFNPQSLLSESDQGKEEVPSISQEGEASPTVMLEPTKLNTWLPLDTVNQYRDDLKKASPKGNQRGNRNQSKELQGTGGSQTSPVQSMHKQYMNLTQANAKQISIKNGNFVSMTNPAKMFTKLARENYSTNDNTEIQQEKKDRTLQQADVSSASQFYDEDYSSKRDDSKKRAGAPTTSVSALGKKRPKTASREASLTKIPPSRQKLKAQLDVVRTPGAPQKISLTQQNASIDQSFRKSGVPMTQTLATPISLSSRPSPSSQTPNILYNKLRSSCPVPSTAMDSQREPQKKIIVLKSGGSRIMTAKNSTRNSPQRQSSNTQKVLSSLQESVSVSLNTTLKSKSRAGSARKKATTFSEKELAMIGSPQTSSATKNLSKVGNAQQYSSARTNTSQQSRSKPSIVTETPPTKIGSGSLISRLLAASTASGTPLNMQYSSVKKTGKPPGSATSSTKRLVSKSPASRDEKGENRTPGGIFTSGSTQGYANLMKNLSPTFKSMHTPLANNKMVAANGQTPKSALNNSALIKGVKLINSHGGYLANKFDATIGQDYNQGPPGYNTVLALEIAQTQASTSSKGAGNNSMHYDQACEISSILNEFERTKNLNKELLLMRNIGSPKQPSSSQGGTGNGGGSYQRQHN